MAVPGQLGRYPGAAPVRFSAFFTGTRSSYLGGSRRGGAASARQKSARPLRQCPGIRGCPESSRQVQSNDGQSADTFFRQPTSFWQCDLQHKVAAAAARYLEQNPLPVHVRLFRRNRSRHSPLRTEGCAIFAVDTALTQPGAIRAGGSAGDEKPRALPADLWADHSGCAASHCLSIGSGLCGVLSDPVGVEPVGGPGDEHPYSRMSAPGAPVNASCLTLYVLPQAASLSAAIRESTPPVF